MHVDVTNTLLRLRRQAESDTLKARMRYLRVGRLGGEEYEYRSGHSFFFFFFFGR